MSKLVTCKDCDHAEKVRGKELYSCIKREFKMTPERRDGKRHCGLHSKLKKVLSKKKDVKGEYQ